MLREKEKKQEKSLQKEGAFWRDGLDERWYTNCNIWVRSNNGYRHGLALMVDIIMVKP